MGSLPPTPSYCDDADALAEVVELHLRRHRLLHRVSRLGVAVSGGADSVALLHLVAPLCLKKGVSITVLHLNHGLREASRGESGFVRALAASLGLPCLAEELRLAEREPDGTSLEMAARAARQAFLARCCARAGLDAVATGHQADDVAETLLLRLARGAGGSGLAALRPRSAAAPALARLAGRPFAFIRPLLPVSARALRDWLVRRGLDWREDASNQSCEIPRNLVRHRLLPSLEKAWGRALRTNLCRSADLLRADDALLEQLAERRLRTVGAGGAIRISRLNRQQEALRRRLLRQWLFSQGMEDACGFESVARLLDFCRAPGSAKLQLAGDTFAVISEGSLRLWRQAPGACEEAALPPQGRTLWNGLEIITEPHQGVCSESHGVGRYPAVCCVDPAALASRPLTVRPRKPGDRILPTGLSGSKKIQDLFVDAKVPEARRDAVPLLTSGDDVVWVPGYRVSRLFRVPAKDAPSLRITVRPATPGPAAPTSKARPGASGH